VGPIQNQVIDTRNAAAPIASPQVLPRTGFSLKNLLPSFNRNVNGAPVLGHSQFPTPAELPNANYFKSFQLQRPGPVGF